MSIATAARSASREEFILACKQDNMAFLDANRKRVYIEYVREPVMPVKRFPWQSLQNDATGEKGRPTAILVAYKQDDGMLAQGWSAAMPATVSEDGYVLKRAERFDKAIGLWKAIRRATGQGRNSARIPNRILSGNKIAEFMERAATELNAKY